jgi:predicted alpha-1,2-mannosidase
MNHHMKLAAASIAAICCLLSGAALASSPHAAAFVTPFIGTDAHGHTYPGASLPHGMVQLSPDGGTSGWDWCSGYHSSDSTIIGFSHTHLSGTGCSDYGDILFMPTTGMLRTAPGSKDVPRSGYRSRFSHARETAAPGSYAVHLDDYTITAELTATRRAGFHKYTFPMTDSANIIIDLVHGIGDVTTDAQITITGGRIIEGWRRSTGWADNHCVFFYAEFSKPFGSFGIAHGDTVAEGSSSARGKNIKAFVSYRTASGEAVYVKVGISHTSPEGAKLNVRTEIADWNFARIKKQAHDEWEKALSAIVVDTANTANATTFYTALYHALLVPNILSDADGSYIGMDGRIHKTRGGVMSTVFSLWDTFRAEHPLFTIIEPDAAGGMVSSLIAKDDEQGMLPVWELASNETGTMIGNHAIPVIVDAWRKGIRGFDAAKAYEAMKRAAMKNVRGMGSYRSMGFIPLDLEHESVSKTLEYAYDDWCIAMMAKDLGKTEDYAVFMERAKFYANLFDPATSLMRPKKNGAWLEPFDPFSVSGNYTEANAWQYSFFVQQDVNGLIALMGGDEKFIAKLDELFTTDPKLTGKFQSDITGLIGQYAHGNEPSHHMAYLYNYAGAPWKTQEKVHTIVSTLYSDKPDGLCGNEDCGQMSAWYVFSALGFYPVCPGDNTYVIGTPLFANAAIRTGGGRTFAVVARNVSEKNFYIQSASLNGKPYASSLLTHADIMKGGRLVLEMGPAPSAWGSAIPSRPRSSIDIPFVQVPFLTSGDAAFRDSTVASFSCIDPSAQIYYTSDGTDPVAAKHAYTHPLTVAASSQINAVCVKNGVCSKVVTASFTKIAVK